MRNRSACARRVAFIGWLVAILTAAPAALAEPLDIAIERLLKHSRLGEARVGIVAVDIESGRPLADIQAEKPFIPASNMKLITTGAALLTLGADFTFRTELIRADETLIVRGSGDPAFGDPEALRRMGMDVEQMLGEWIDTVERSGPAPNELIIDARIFDDQRVHPTWPRDQLNRWYEAEVAGLNFHTNVVSFHLTPSAPDSAPNVSIQPAAPWLLVRNRATTVDNGRNTVWVGRPPESNTMTVYGEVRRATGEPIRVAVHNPPRFFGRLFRHRLENAGLAPPDVHVADQGQALPDGRMIAVVETPLPLALSRCNTDSHNLYAEALLKRMGYEVTGRPGSWTTGAAVMRMLIHERLGVADAASAVIADGSGLSRQNRLTPRLIARWLTDLHAAEDNIADVFRQSLPRAGAEGTLADRFDDVDLQSRVRAKSGYIRGVSCLSGYVLDEATGRPAAFSILVNDVPSDVPIARVKTFQERVVLLIDQWLDQQSAETAEAPADLGG